MAAMQSLLLGGCPLAWPAIDATMMFGAMSRVAGAGMAVEA